MTSVTGPTRAAPGARDAVFAQLSDTGRAEQVARRLADAIVLGVLAPGERLPSEAELSRRFGVALVTARDGLGMLRDAGLVETRRGREGGSFVVDGAEATGDRDDAFLESRLRGLAQVELADLAVYVGTIAEGCADRAAERSTPVDHTRLRAWLDAASFDSAGEARRNASGFFLELAVLSQSTRLVREQIRLQAEFGPLLWLGMRDSFLREHTAGAARSIADAVSRGDGAAARGEVADLVRLITEWLLAAKLRVQRGGTLDA